MAISHLDYLNKLEDGQVSVLDNDSKLVYLTAQIDEFKHTLYRHQVDILLSEHLMKSTNEGVAKQGRDNYHQYTLVIKQMKNALKIVTELRDQVDSQE